MYEQSEFEAESFSRSELSRGPGGSSLDASLEASFEAVLRRVEAYLQWKHDFEVHEGSFLENGAALFFGNAVMLNKELSFEAKLFTVVHLFGHSVQKALGEALEPFPEIHEPGAEAAIKAYEVRASEYGVELLAKLGLER